MSHLKNDILKHTIFLQRLASRDKKQILRNVKELAVRLLKYGNNYNTLSIRNNVAKEEADSISHEDSITSLYEYERRFIKRLIRKHEKNNIK